MTAPGGAACVCTQVCYIVHTMAKLSTRTATLSLRIDPKVKEGLEKASAEDRRSVASLVEKIAADWLKERGYLKR